MPDVDPACALPPLRPRPTVTGRGRARRLVAAALLAATALFAACGDDPQVACGEAYEHLLTIGRRTHDADLRARFVKSCVEAYDKKKIACIQRAATPEEALACKWFKKRPG
ncbi:MAG: hypothetical protein EP329_13480 [Deltaproteobacteria bacterium]|nr:MAG: hypothetical protein EP329_13480 [Deltaproteobacteria bacterium]